MQIPWAANLGCRGMTPSQFSAAAPQDLDYTVAIFEADPRLGVPIIRTILFWGPYWGPAFGETTQSIAYLRVMNRALESAAPSSFT